MSKKDEALADHIGDANKMVAQPAQGCEFCSHPLYAGTKCKHCGRPAQQDIPKIGCVNHDCDKCKARQQQEHVSLMTVLHLKDRTEIGYGPASAGYDLPTGEYKLYTSPPASKPLTDEQQIAEALRRHGLMLVKTAAGYDVLKLGQIAAHGIKGEA